MKKALIVYFTGTGHTARLGKELKSPLAELGYETELFSIDRYPDKDTSGYDLLVFAYPIHAFNMPGYYWNYVKKMDLREGQDCLICKQSGEPIHLNDPSSIPLIKKIGREGARFLGEYHFLYPYNIHFRYPDDFVKELISYNDKLRTILTHNLKNGIVRLVDYNILNHLAATILRIQRFAGPVNSFFYKVDPSKCNQCGMCIRTCPTENIYLKDGKMKFHHRCAMCMRCSFLCPQDAFSIGFLEGWHVNGMYPFNKIEKDESLKGEYSSTKEKGFYSWFKRVFESVNEEYEAIMSGANQEPAPKLS